MNYSLSVIVPTLTNTKGLEHQLNYLQDKNCQLIIIDNQPNDEKKLLIKEFQKIYQKRLIYSPQKKNLGFSASINLGSKQAIGEWFLILNDDVEFKDDQSINRLVTYAKKGGLDAISPVLINSNGEIENLGYKVLPYGKIDIIKNPKSKILNLKQIPNSQLQILNSNIDGLTAACLLIKKSVFDSLGGFDESFFAYLEDVEFFLRFKKAGFKMSIAKDIFVLHHHMTTSKTMGSFKAQKDLINWWRLYFKHRHKFKFNLNFILERLYNLSGLIKSFLKI